MQPIRVGDPLTYVGESFDEIKLTRVQRQRESLACIWARHFAGGGLPQGLASLPTPGLLTFSLAPMAKSQPMDLAVVEPEFLF